LTRCGRKSGVSLGNPDRVRLTGSFGCPGLSLESVREVAYRGLERARELVPVLETAFATPGPGVGDVPVDLQETLRPSERLGQLVCQI
jgi:hypothetical protein